jgi:hypothetical protein
MTRWVAIQKEWSKTTLAKFTPGANQPEISYREVAMTCEAPRPRIYK